MHKWLVGLVSCAAFSFFFASAASATPITEDPSVTDSSDTYEITGQIIGGHDDAYSLYEHTQTVTTLTGYIVPGSYDQFYIPTTEQISAGTDCSTADDLDEALWALILDMDDLWVFLV